MLELPGLTLFCILNPAHSRISAYEGMIIPPPTSMTWPLM